MSQHIPGRGRALLLAAVSAIPLVAMYASMNAGAAQQPPAAAPQGPRTPRAAAPVDLTGYWVSVVTDDWRWRMITAPKGDYRAVPYNNEGRKLAEAWDLAKDNATGNQCKAYGAAGIMRIPGRLHIVWESDTTLKIETDAGKQVRTIHMLTDRTTGGGLVGEALRAKPAQATLQGYSVGVWQMRDSDAPKGGGALVGGTYVEPPARPEKGSLKVVTVGLRPGYLRKNGLPYSENTVLTEYFDRHEDFGTQWFTVTTVVDDPKYLVTPFVTTTHFKKEADAAKWNPSACETMAPTTDREEQYFDRRGADR